MHQRHLLVFLLPILFALLATNRIQAGEEAVPSCIVCGMEVKAKARAAFESFKEGKPVHFCSYSCAHAFQNKYPKAPLHAYDFETGASIDTKTAYFLIKSENLVKEMEFGMAPLVIAFSNEDSAKKKQAQLNDGEVVHGSDKLKSAFP